MFRTLCVLGLICVFVLLLGAPPASAAGSREPEGLSVRGVLSALWETLARHIPVLGVETADEVPGGEPTNGGGEGGPVMDPNGKPTGH